MVGFVPEPPPNVLVFTFRFVGIGDAMQPFRTWFSSHLWCCLEERQRNYLGYIRVIHVFVRGQLGSWVAGWIACSFSQVVRYLKVSGLFCKLNYDVEQGDPGSCCGNSLPSSQRTCLSGAVCPISPSPEQVDWAAAPVLPLTDPPQQCCCNRTLWFTRTGQQEIPTSAPRRKEEAGEAPWLRVMPESLHTRFLGWCSARTSRYPDPVRSPGHHSLKCSWN